MGQEVNDYQEIGSSILTKMVNEIRTSSAPILPLSERYPELTVADAVKIRDLAIGSRLSRGERLVGAKISLGDPVSGPGARPRESRLGWLTEGMLLADPFVDLKNLIRAICTSQTYQRTSKPHDGNDDDPTLFSHMAIKVLSPEQLYDSLVQVLGKGGAFQRQRDLRGDRFQPGGFPIGMDGYAADGDASAEYRKRSGYLRPGKRWPQRRIRTNSAVRADA